MLKAMGCFFIIYASFMTGHAVGNYHTRMVKEMEELILLMHIIRDQIIYEGTEIPELLETCEKRAYGGVKIWLRHLSRAIADCRDKSFAEIWQESMGVLTDQTALREDTVDEMRRFGTILGDMDVEAQVSRMNLIENIVEDRYEKERSRNGGIRRLSGSLGLLGGLFIVIMLF